MGMRFIGIDEAGRGPVIGPLTIAGISADEKTLEKFKEIGVKDSKLLSIRRIFQLERIIKENTEYKVVIKSAKEIDDRFAIQKNLNYFELDEMAEIANSLKGDRVTIDSPSANIKKVENYLSQKIVGKTVIARNYADRDYTEVGAASILAKAQREREVEKIKKIFEYDFGSGYPSDPKTKLFLKIIKYNNKINEYPYSDYIRKSWLTIKNLNNINLNDFL